MTEYEIATLAARDVALWVAVAQVAATVAVGLAQVAVVWYGIRAMLRASTTRAIATERADQQRAREQDQRHAEAMTALRELIERTAPAAR